MEAEASRERELRPPDWGGSADLDTLPPEGFSADCVADLVLPPLFAGGARARVPLVPRALLPPPLVPGGLRRLVALEQRAHARGWGHVNLRRLALAGAEAARAVVLGGVLLLQLPDQPLGLIVHVRRGHHGDR